MSKMRIYILLVLLASFCCSHAQRNYRNYLRGGNKFYVDSLFDKSEIQYRKALEKDANGVDALYNLGNSLLMQQKIQDAMSQYQIAEKREASADKLAEIHHNMGVIHQGTKDYAAAVEAYKQSLRENPNDHETRYNLALAMHQLKQQQQQQEQQQEMSKENAEQILQAAMQDEKDVQEKVKKMMQLRGRKLEKDW